MSVLSNVDIERELGKNIYIHPLKFVNGECSNIKGATINFTASNLAWKVSDKTSALNSQKKIIEIPPHDTVLIETEETIYVSDKICGTYHSKCKHVSKGLGHIGTTLDPEFVGPSLIAVHNHTDKKIDIQVGETFVSIKLYYLNNKSTKENTNNPGQENLLNGFDLTSEEKKWLDTDWRKSPDKLKKIMINSEPYKRIKDNYRNEHKWRYSLGNYFLKILLFVVAIFISYKIFKYLKIKMFPSIDESIFVVAWVSMVITIVVNSIKNIPRR